MEKKSVRGLFFKLHFARKKRERGGSPPPILPLHFPYLPSPPPPPLHRGEFDSVYFSRFRIFLAHYQREATHRRLPRTPRRSPVLDDRAPPLDEGPCLCVCGNNVNRRLLRSRRRRRRRVYIERKRDSAANDGGEGSFLKVSFLILTLTNTQRFIISCSPPTCIYTARSCTAARLPHRRTAV